MADDWKRVGGAIQARIADLALSKAEVIRQSGVSDKTLTGYINGNPIKRPDKRRELCLALGWTPDSIDRLLAGNEPKELDAAPMTDLSKRFDALDERMAAIEQALRDLLRRGS